MESNDEVSVPEVTMDVVPKIGQQFESLDEACDFYNSYAKRAGFGTRISGSKKSKATNEVVWKMYVCSKEGQTDDTYQIKKKNVVPRAGERKRGQVRCGCGARMTVVKKNGENTWVVSYFVEGHNHVLSTPSKTHLLRSHRKVSATTRALTEEFSKANIPTCQQIRLLEIDAGGPSLLGFVAKDIRNHKRDRQQDGLGHDAETLVQYFELEKQRDSNFYYVYETDDEGMFSRCFWADSESRSSYVYFGDAMVFDTTYNTNKYSLVFAPFVGVNQHRQTTVFGCGLLNDEKAESFIWLFSRFLEGMPNRQPPTIIVTDLDAAISKAVNHVFPETVHRFCLWHILNKFSEKMSPVLYREQYHRLVSIIKQSESAEEFEMRWSEVMETSELGSNDWLRTMYEIRSRWIPAYFSHVFAAGMSSSQRSESNHAFFKRYVNKKNTLMDFITRFSGALSHQRHEELMANHIDINEQPRVSTAFLMESQMASIYTKAVFLLFQEELQQSTHYIVSKKSSTDSMKVYLIARFEANASHHRQRILTHFTTSDRISCSCRLFEFHGYPCRHMLSLMIKKQVKLLPDIYILRRWMKEAKVNPVFEQDPNTEKGKSVISRHGLLAQLASELVDEGAVTEDRCTFLLDQFRHLKKRVKEFNDGDDGLSRNRNLSIEETPIINDPAVVRTKGCRKRFKSSKEISMSQSKRKCRECKITGHDKRTCPSLQPITQLIDEPYQPHFSWEQPQDDRFTSVASSDYNAINEFVNDGF